MSPGNFPIPSFDPRLKNSPIIIKTIPIEIKIFPKLLKSPIVHIIEKIP